MTKIKDLKKLGKNFWLFRGGQFFSSLGSGGTSVAIIWWLADKTKSSLTLSSIVTITTLTYAIGTILLSPIGDKFSRKIIALTGDFLSILFSFILFILLCYDYFNIPLLLSILVLLNISYCIFGAGSRGFIAQLVDKENFQLAYSVATSLEATASILGGTLGGIIVGLLSAKWAILFDTLTFVIAAGMTFSMKIQNKIVIEYVEKKIGGIYSQWKNGLLVSGKMLLKIKEYRYILMLSLILNLAVAPIDILLTFFVKNTIKYPAWYYGLLDSIISLGAVIGPIALTFFNNKIRQSTMLYISFILLSFSLVCFPIYSSLTPLISALILGSCMSIINILIMTPFSICTPDNFRSRLHGIFFSIIIILKPISILSIGFMLKVFSIQEIFIFISIFIMISIFFIRNKKLSLFLCVDEIESKNFIMKNFQ